MTSNNTPDTPQPPEEKSQYQILKEGGYNDLPSFMHSYGLKMHNDEDIQEAKEILRRFDEYDRAYPNDKTLEDEKPQINEDDETGPDSPGGVRIPYEDHLRDDDDDLNEEVGCPVEGDFSHFEWGVDEPEFEGYPAFSDDGEGYGYNQGDDDADYDNYGEDR
ncbi:hypothetical protein BDV06DRAFT_221519 [Aspergillus oleicola]